MTNAKADPFDGYEEVKPQNVTFTAVNDYIKGTYIDKFTPTQPDQYGNLKPAYIIKIEEGEFHDSDGKKVIPEAGSHYRFWGGKAAIDSAMGQAKLGQMVGFKLMELRATKKGNDAKIIKTLLGGMDEKWITENEPVDNLAGF